MRRLTIAALIVATACVRAPREPALVPAGDLPTALAEAATAAQMRRYVRADSVLAAYMRAQWGAPGAREAAYWRAVYQLDPQNPDGTAQAAIPLLELYLAPAEPGHHTAAAQALRGLALRQDSLRLALLEASTTPDSLARRRAEPAPRAEELEKEVARLKEQLAQTTAELERVKRRVTTPP